MGSLDAKRLVAMSALVSFALLFLASLSPRGGGQLPTSRQWIGLAIAFLMMSVLADLGVPLGGGLAVLTMVTMMLTKGKDALSFATGKLKPTKPSAGASTPTAPATGQPITLAAMRGAAGTLGAPATPGRPPAQAGGGPGRMVPVHSLPAIPTRRS